jgi:hypothetical protein
MENPTDKIVTELKRQFPGWHVWVVHHAVGGQTWCARRRGDEKQVVNADSADGLAELLEAEAER